MQVARLHPDPAIVDLETELSGLDLAARAPSAVETMLRIR